MLSSSCISSTVRAAEQAAGRGQQQQRRAEGGGDELVPIFQNRYVFRAVVQAESIARAHRLFALHFYWLQSWGDRHPKMSRPKAVGGSSQKTLFSFFSKSPAPVPQVSCTPLPPLSGESIGQSSGVTTGSSADVSSSTAVGIIPKRRRVVHDDDDDDVEQDCDKINKLSTLPRKKLMSTPVSDEEWSSGPEMSSEDEECKSVEKKARPSIPRPPKPTLFMKPPSQQIVKKIPAATTPPVSCQTSNGQGDLTPDLPDGVFSAGSHEHHSWSFLKNENRRDKAGRLLKDPLFNPRTLLVPASVLNEFTPALRQWMEFKSDNMDTVLFFKVGKFYELYHMDADIGASELDLVYMKGPKAHVGFPEVTYGKYSNTLVSRGYKVARIEQTEVPDIILAFPVFEIYCRLLKC